MSRSYPLDLDERIKKYLIENNEEWDKSKHHMYIQNNKNNTEILVIDMWKYKCNIPSTKDIEIHPLKILVNISLKK